ncbi:MAG: DUF1552 domain-containing protein [Myxococcota bacterium]
MHNFTLKRRSFLRGALKGALVAVALPPLEAMFSRHGEAYADGTSPPTRFGLWFFGNGVQLDRWIERPAPGTQPPAVRPGWWNYLPAGSPLEALSGTDLRSYLSVVSGTQCTLNTGSVHNEGRCGMMTGSFDIHIGQYGAATLPSADQLYASEFGHLTPFPSLEVGVSDTGPNVSFRRTRGETSTIGGGVYLPMEKDPIALYQRLFGARQTGPRLDGSVISAVRRDTCRLKARLGSDDQHRLDAHLDGLADLERRLSQPAMCAAPAEPNGTYVRTADADGFVREPLQAKSEAISRLLAYALKCDLTRTFCVEFSPYQAATIYPGTTTDFHTLTHSETIRMEGGVLGSELVARCVRFTMERFGDLLRELIQAEDLPGVPVLENTAIVTVTDLNQGYYHGLEDMPILVAGRAGGLRSGNFYRFENELSGRVMLSALQAAGSSRTSFGTGSIRADRPFSELW